MALKLFVPQIRKLIFLLTMFFILVTSAQNQKTVWGIVSSQGLPLSGASVMVKDTKIGTMTDFDGKFSLSVPENAKILIVSFLGFTTQEVEIKNEEMLIRLLESQYTLDEVVITALGIKREEKALGYAVQKVKGESLQQVSGVDVTSALTGKVAGLLVKNPTDFAARPVLTIRGESPLIVIDGIAYENKTLGDISSEDIESLNILKGATASALYGFRGQSGVLLITTKNGSTNKTGLNIDFTSNTMFTAGFLAIPVKQSVYGRGSNNTYDKNSDESWGTRMDGQILNQWDPYLKQYRDYEYLPIGKDNFANFLEQGYVTNNNFNVGFKGENIALRSSLNWTENKGQYPNSIMDKFTYTLGGEASINKFKLNSNLAYARKTSPNEGSNGYTSYDPMYNLLIWSAADYNILDYKDNYWIIPEEKQNFTYLSGTNNPYFDKYEKINETSRDIFNADLSMNYQLTNWLKTTVRSGLDFYMDSGEIRISKGSFSSSGNTPIPGNPYTWIGGTTGAYATGKTQGFSINSDLLFTGEREFSKINVEYLAGGTIYYKRDDNINARTDGGLSIPGFFSLNASVNTPKSSESTYARQVNSLYGRIGISWDKFIFVEATGRNDWSSTLSLETHSYFYPSVASSFVVSELLPDSTKGWLDLLKIRSSWTQSKNIPSIYEINPSYSIYSGTWNSLNGASAPSSLYPSDILPSSSDSYEIGLQSMFFKNRLMFDITNYSKRFYDGIITGDITSASGYSGIKTNSQEETTRKGWEITLNSSPLKNENWKLDFGINWSTYKTIYTKLDPLYSSKKPWVQVGERVDVLNSKEFLRDPATGKLIYNNGRLQLSPYESVFGYRDPDWIWGFNSTLKYKAFSLFMSIDGVVGGLMNTRTESYMWQTGGHPDSLTEERALDVATPGSTNYLGDGVKIVSGTVTYDSYGNILTDTRVFAINDIKTTYKQAMIDLHGSSAWGGNGTRPDTYEKTFLKLREISLTYTIPNTLLKNLAAKSASVSFVGQNVFLWAKDFKYSDPDAGQEDFSDPSVRYLGGNIKLTF